MLEKHHEVQKRQIQSHTPGMEQTYAGDQMAVKLCCRRQPRGAGG